MVPVEGVTGTYNVNFFMDQNLATHVGGKRVTLSSLATRAIASS